MNYCIQGAQVLHPDGFTQGDLLIEDGRIVSDLSDEPCLVDATGCWILPGIIDLHGDAFERAMTPRPGVDFPVAQGLAENDAALIACGITSFFYAITDGFEPGLRSRATVRRLLHHLEDLAPRLRCRSMVHIRHETANVEAPEELRDWMQQGRIHLLSLNDHLPNLDDAERLQRYRRGLTRRVSMDDTEISAFLHGLQAQHAQGLQIVDQLCAWTDYRRRLSALPHYQWAGAGNPRRCRFGLVAALPGCYLGTGGRSPPPSGLVGSVCPALVAGLCPRTGARPHRKTV